MADTRPTMKVLANFVAQRLREVEAERAALLDTLEQIRLYPDQAEWQACPFCGGQMLFLKPLRGKIRVGGSQSGRTIKDDVPHFYMDWECQACGITRNDHEEPPAEPRGKMERWDRATTPRRASTVAAELFRKYARLRTIVKYSLRNEREWYLAMSDGHWYYFRGPARALRDWLPDPDQINP